MKQGKKVSKQKSVVALESDNQVAVDRFQTYYWLVRRS